MSDTDNAPEMFAEDDLDDVLNGTSNSANDKAEETPAEPDPEPEPAAPVVEAKGEDDAPPASQQEQMVPLTAVQAERKKRQEVERELEELRRSQRPQNAIDPLEDPQGFSEQVQRQVALVRFELQEEAMRERHEDYEEMQDEFIELAKQNPTLQVELAKASNAPRFAYETAKKARELKKLENVEDYKSELRKQVEAQIRAEMAAEAAKTAGKRAKLAEAAELPSLATIGSGGSDADVEPDVTSILGADPTQRRRR